MTRTAACRAQAACTYVGISILLLTALACQKPQTILAAPTPGPGQSQLIEAQGPGGDVGWWPQVIFDAHDHGHIAYCDAHAGTLRYGSQNPNGWALETVTDQTKAGKYISLASAPSGAIGITYYNQTSHYFDYATRLHPNGPWHIEHIAWGLEAGMASALGYSADGHAHVLYYISSGKVIYASRAPEPGARWLKMEVGDYQAVYSARVGALTEPSGVWFSYVNWQMNAATLYVGQPKKQGWQQSIVPTGRGAGWRSQLARVGNDLWVLHSDNLSENTALSFLDSDNLWHTSTLVRGGSSFALAAYKGRGVVVFAQRDKRHRGLYLTQQSDTGPWPVTEIASGVGNDPDVSMAIDSCGRVLVVYYDLSIHGLKSYTTSLGD